MRKMGESIGRLDRLVKDAEPSDTIQQEKIIAELSKLEGNVISFVSD
jgi:hypothetical protein